MSAFTNPTHARGTSSGRDFVVLDNFVHYSLDSNVSNDSSPSTSTDVHNRCVDGDIEILDADDQLDLDMDIQSRFAYNSRLLRGIRRARNI